MTEQTKNTGLIMEPPMPRDWTLGGVSGADRAEIMADGDWTEFLPEFEMQRQSGLETMRCVTESALNCIEMVEFLKTGMRSNYSERASAATNGTTRRGNTFSRVALAIVRQGLAPEAMWPWPGRDPVTWEEYYAKPPKQVIDAMTLWLMDWDPQYEWVTRGDGQSRERAYAEALRYGPLQVCNDMHAFCLVKHVGDGRFVTFDSYPGSGGDGVGEVHVDEIRAAMLWHLNARDDGETKPGIALPEECKVFEGEGLGRTGLHMRNRIYVDDNSKLESVWMDRNAKGEGPVKMFESGPRATLTTDAFDSFPHYDLKGNKLK